MTSTPPEGDPKPKGPSIEQLYERHRHHRGLATALSATIIGLSGGLFYALMSPSPDPVVLVLDRIARGLLGLSVVAAVLLQFFHVLGYVHHARAINKQLMASVNPQSEREQFYSEIRTELGDAQKAFDNMDLTVKAAVFIHLAGLIAVGIGHI